MRRAEIVHLASTSGLASVEQLSERFGVTASTIRRDLAKLTGQGRIARTYGGAMGLNAHPEASLRQRMGEAYAAKRAIATWCRQQIVPGEVILLDAGSTTGALAGQLQEHEDLTVVSAGMTAVELLLDSPGVEVLALGGRLRPMSQAFIGPLAEIALTRVSCDRAFMGTDGVVPGRGICEADLQQTRLKELMMSRADQVYVLAHGEKVGRAAFHAWAQMPARWTLVTDSSADPQVLDQFSTAEVEIIIADDVPESGSQSAS
nr:DeoR/GlpR family DNA-binding transcription regulator [Arsenicicoccus piscis]